MAFMLTRAVGRLRLVSSTPRLFQTISPTIQSKPHFSFSSTLFGQPLVRSKLQRLILVWIEWYIAETARFVGHVVYAGETKIRCSKSAEKRHRQSEKRRVMNRARKNEVKTRMKRVSICILSFIYFDF